MGYLTREDLGEIGFKSFGDNVLISDKASIYNPGNISIGSHVRIDDFCVISAGLGGVEIGSYVHLAVFSSLIGAGRITLSDFSNISSRVSIYSSNDDYSGASLTNPMIPDAYKNVESSDVLISKHVIIGCGSVILPGVTLNEGAAVGAMSLIVKDCDAFVIYSGVPAKAIKPRKEDLIILEKKFIEDNDW